MTEEYEYETGLDPEQIFSEGAATGQADLQEELGERLQSELGLSGEEVEALFDPAPRRGKGRRKGKRCGTAKQHRAMPQIFSSVCSGKARTFDPKPKRRGKGRRGNARRYDPAPLRETVRNTMRKVRKNKYVKKAKSAGSKLLDRAQPYIPYAVGGVALYSLYNTHLTDLKAAGKLNKDGTPVNTLVDAVMYDINNWSTIGGGLTGAGTRVGDHWKEILGGTVGGLVIAEGTKGTKYAKAGKVVGWSAAGIGIAYLIKALLDPPVQGRQTQASVRQPVRTVYQPAPQPQITESQNYPSQTYSQAPQPYASNTQSNPYAGV